MTGRFALGAVALLLALAVALLAPLHAHAGPARESKWLTEESQATVGNPGLYSGLYTGCPGDKYFPYGGVFSPMPMPSPSGTGLYPLGFERRGAQKDNHFVLTLFNPTAPTSSFVGEGVTVCGPKIKLAAIQTITQVNPGQTGSLVSTCPTGTTLIGGNFARTFFTPQGGDFATESRGDILNNSWVVSATGFGSFGGPVTDTAFCGKFKRPNVRVIELPGSVQINPHSVGVVSTTACPARTQWVWGGFNESPQGSVMFVGGYLYQGGWYAGYGYNRTNSPATFDYFSYCLPKNAVKPLKKRKKP